MLIGRAWYKNESIMLCQAKGFYKTSTLGNNEVRLTYVYNLENLEISLNISLKIYK